MVEPTQTNLTYTAPVYEAPAPATPVDAPVSDQQIEDTADAILDTGEQWFTDDYDSRMVRYAEEMAKLSPEDGARLNEALLQKDGGALASWLKLDTLDRMQNDGRISQDQYAAVSEGFTTAYNAGQISTQQAETFLGTQRLNEVAPGIAPDQWNQLREFLGASNSSDATQTFRENFAEHLLAKPLDANNIHSAHDAGIAMQIASDSGDPDMAARVFASVAERAGDGISDPAKAAAAREEARGKLLEAIGQSSIGFENSAGAFDGLVNPMATLIDSVARQPDTEQWNETAVGIARYAESSDNDVFYDPYTDKPIASTAEALTNLLAGNQGDAVLTALSNWDGSGVTGRDGHAQQFGQNAIELGNLLRITAFNPDNPDAQQALNAVQEWAQLRKDYLNGVERSDYPADLSVSTARQQLGMLGGAAFDAVQQMKIDQDNRAAATEALVGFVVDLGLSVVPGGGKISELVAGDLKAAFGNNPRIDGLIDEALSGGDTLTSSAIDKLKSEIAGALSDDQVDLEALRTTASNFVTSAVVSGLSEGTPADGGQSHRDIVESHVQTVQDDIQDNRK